MTKCKARTGFFVAAMLLSLPSQMADADTGRSWTEQILVGGKVGIEYAKFGRVESQDGLFEHSHKMGLQAGAVLGFRLVEPVIIATEFTFSSKGSKLDSSAPGMSDGEYVIDYIEIPLLAQLSVPLSGRVRPYGTLGPAMAILLDEEYVQADGTRLQLSTGKPLVWSLILGLGTRVDLGKSGALVFDARYDLGLSARSKTTDTSNNSFCFTIGYQVALSIFSGGR
jgi:hypothetical protein